MFLGHFGLGFAGKRLAPGVSLGTLFLATQWADLLFWVLTVAGVEHLRIAPGATRVTPMDFYDYPWSHGLLALAVWAIVIGALYVLFRRSRAGAWLLGLGMLSHWALDALMHRPDMPTWPGGPRVGLGIWNSIPLTVVAEAIVFAWGIALYRKVTIPRDRVGTWALWSLVAFLAALWLVSIFGPPPPSEHAVAWAGLAMWLFVPWGWWIDRHRIIVRP